MENIRLSKDEKFIEFKRMENLPNSPKKFRKSPELENFYSFVFEHDIRKETFQIINKIYKEKKFGKKS